jgi:negative regulator of sigma E activity
MGSDFTNDDLIKESSVLKDYNHSLIGDTLIQNRDCYIIELIPKPEAAIVWGKIHSYIDKKDFLQLESRFYDEDGYLINKMEASEIKNLGGRLLPSLMVMTPVEEDGQQTILRYKSIEFDLPLEASFFSKQNMKRLR